MSKRRKRAFVLLLLGGIVLGFGATIFWLLSDYLLLTRRATQVAAIPYSDMRYAWVSNHEFVMYNSTPDQSPLTLVDIKTGEKRALEGLQGRVWDALRWGGNLMVSPDGTHALCSSGGVRQEICAAPLDGSSLTNYVTNRSAFPQDPLPIWLPNSKEWVNLFTDEGGPVHLHEFNISIPETTMDPAGDNLTEGEEVVLSPQGDRLAWILYVLEEQPAWLTRLARWIPSLQKAPQPRIELRTCKLDGSDVEIVGYLEPKPGKTAPHDLHWLPDGKNLSFLYQDALWTIPAG